MNVQELSTAPLSRGEEHRHILAVQRAEDGAQGSWEALLASHQRAIVAASRRVPTYDAEDAYSVALEAFVETVQTFDLDLGLRLSTVAYPTMARAVLLAASSDKAVSIPGKTVTRYLALMQKAEGDVNVAYRMAQEGGHHISADNFLATHRAMSDTYDADEVLGETTGVGGEGLIATRRGSEGWIDRGKNYTPAPTHEEIDVEMADRVLSWVDDAERLALRLSYGFRGPVLDMARVDAGFREDEPLNPRELGVVLGCSRSTARRMVERGIDIIRERIRHNIEEENAE